MENEQNTVKKVIQGVDGGDNDYTSRAVGASSSLLISWLKICVYQCFHNKFIYINMYVNKYMRW